jgi:hypothetical protein
LNKESNQANDERRPTTRQSDKTEKAEYDDVAAENRRMKPINRQRALPLPFAEIVLEAECRKQIAGPLSGPTR